MALVFAKSIARRAVLDSEGVGDAEGATLTASPEAIDALLGVRPLFEAFQLGYVASRCSSALPVAVPGETAPSAA
jgi:hypothetical protein